jgi:signal peptidase I
MTDTPEAPVVAPEPVPTDPAPKTDGAKPAKKEDWRDTLKFLLKLAVVVFIFRSFLFSPFSIPSQSMLPRLYIGDYLFISKWNYGYSRHSLPWSLPLIPGRIFPGTPARGDVVVFKSPTGSGEDVIKRVIGLPGDTVQMRGGQLILNGQAIPKVRIADFVIPLSPNYRDPRPNDDGCPQDHRDAAQTICHYKQYRETLPAADGKPAVSYNVLDRNENQPGADDTDLYSVPAGHIFVMGDNRDDSGDSRFPVPDGMGYVPLETVEGKAILTFWSTDGSAQWLLPWTWFTAARWSRMGQTF